MRRQKGPAGGSRALPRAPASQRPGFMHESFNPDAPQRFSRPWFAWCNSMFGELVSTLADTKPQVLATV